MGGGIIVEFFLPPPPHAPSLRKGPICVFRAIKFCSMQIAPYLIIFRELADFLAASSWIGIVIPSSLAPVLNHGSRC